MSTDTTYRRTGLLLTAVAVAALGLAGCSSGPVASDKAARSAGAPPPGVTEQRGLTQDAAKAPGDASANTSVGGKAPAAKLAPSERSIVYKGELTVRVTKKIEDAAKDVSALATRLGGYVASDNRTQAGKNSSADLQLRIPGKAFKEAVEAAADLGEEVKRNFDTEDVTEAVVDIEARIASQRASVDRVRTLLSRAEKVTDLAAVEGELARREADLASLEAQQRSLAGQVEFSTVTVRLVGPSAKVEKDEDMTFLSALGAGWDALVTAGNAVLIAFGAILPFLLVLGLPLALAFWLLRRRNRARRGAAIAPAEGPAAS